MKWTDIIVAVIACLALGLSIANTIRGENARQAANAPTPILQGAHVDIADVEGAGRVASLYVLFLNPGDVPIEVGEVQLLRMGNVTRGSHPLASLDQAEPDRATFTLKPRESTGLRFLVSVQPMQQDDLQRLIERSDFDMDIVVKYVSRGKTKETRFDGARWPFDPATPPPVSPFF